ncbi:MAG: hypothetical protein IJ074_00205 [Clostridia bacterium]|nr:hypothetical protein [Clostridia bacterium]
MFENIGNKIMKVANMICWLGIIGAVVAGISTAAVSQNAFIGILTFVVGAIGAWIGALGFYGFGKLINDTQTIAVQVTSIEMKIGK